MRRPKVKEEQPLRERGASRARGGTDVGCDRYGRQETGGESCGVGCGLAVWLGVVRLASGLWAGGGPCH